MGMQNIANSYKRASCYHTFSLLDSHQSTRSTRTGLHRPHAARRTSASPPHQRDTVTTGHTLTTAKSPSRTHPESRSPRVATLITLNSRERGHASRTRRVRRHCLAQPERLRERDTSDVTPPLHHVHVTRCRALCRVQLIRRSARVIHDT